MLPYILFTILFVAAALFFDRSRRRRAAHGAPAPYDTAQAPVAQYQVTVVEKVPVQVAGVPTPRPHVTMAGLFRRDDGTPFRVWVPQSEADTFRAGDRGLLTVQSNCLLGFEKT